MVDVFPAFCVWSDLELRQSCRVRSDREMVNSECSSESDDDLLYPFASSEARRLYWAGRLHVSINLLASQSQLDLLRDSPHPTLQHRSRSLFNILQERNLKEWKDDECSSFVESKWPPLRQQTKVINTTSTQSTHKERRSPAVTVQFPFQRATCLFRLNT